MPNLFALRSVFVLVLVGRSVCVWAFKLGEYMPKCFGCSILLCAMAFQAVYRRLIVKFMRIHAEIFSRFDLFPANACLVALSGARGRDREKQKNDIFVTSLQALRVVIAIVMKVAVRLRLRI